VSRPRLLVLNQYFRPGPEATAQLLADLCDALADEFDITVVTGRVRGAANSASPERSNGREPTVVRVPSTVFDRSSLWLRAANYTTFLLGAALAGLRAPRPDVVLSMTDPPVIGAVALAVARRAGRPLVVVVQDVFPETAVELRRVENRLVIELLRRAIRRYLARADVVVAIGETMRRRLEAKGASAGRLRVIPNWVDTTVLTPQPRRNEWSAAQGFDDRFVVMHSGNLGHAQDLDSLLRAATLLRDLDDLVIVLIGDGARRAELVSLARSLDVDDRVRFLPFQARAALPLSLSSADVHVVGLAHGLSGYVVPSRLYGILAVGRPVIVAADAESETAQVVERAGSGLVVPPGWPDLLAAAIRSARAGEVDLAAAGAAGREWVVANADRSLAIERYRAVLREVAPA
jgi:glycosyltransferase involved in cell wall biosynthesis